MDTLAFTNTCFSTNQENTTFTCPFGTYAYICMPLGLCNAPDNSQRCMTAIFFDFCEKIVEVFMDDFFYLWELF